MPDLTFLANPDRGLKYVDLEISYGDQWISLNDHDKFIINGSNTRDNTSKTWRKVTAQSPVLGGTYLVHAVPELVSEQVSIWIYGADQTDLADNYFFIEELFEQPSYRLRWTYNDYRETWDCQLADASISRNQVNTHNTMAMVTYTVPRFPNVTRERL